MSRLLPKKYRDVRPGDVHLNQQINNFGEISEAEQREPTTA